MLKIRSARVRSLDLDFHELSWELEATSDDPFDFTLRVLRSESQEGPFEQLGGEFQNRTSFVDNVLQIGHKWRRYYYTIRVVRRSDGAFVDYGPYSNEPEPDLMGAEVRRHVDLLMRQYAGRKVWVLPARTSGPRCSCWDSVLCEKVRSGCRECFGSGFAGGYLSPIEAWVQIDPSPKSDGQGSAIPPTQQVNTTLRMGYYPTLRPGDLIVELENRRWRVVSVTSTEKDRAALHQEALVHELDPGDVEFAIPINLAEAVRDVRTSMGRDPVLTNFEGFGDEELSSALSLYQRGNYKL